MGRLTPCNPEPQDAHFFHKRANENTSSKLDVPTANCETRRDFNETRRRRLVRCKYQGHNDELKVISLNEVAWHDTLENCWVTIDDYVYDITDFFQNHPGGQDVLFEYAGRDATLAFIGTGHSMVAKQILDRYLIGELPRGERIFRIPDGIKVEDR